MKLNDFFLILFYVFCKGLNLYYRVKMNYYRGFLTYFLHPELMTFVIISRSPYSILLIQFPGVYKQVYALYLQYF